MDKMFKHAAVGDERGYLVSDDEDGDSGDGTENVAEITEKGESDKEEGKKSETGSVVAGGSGVTETVVRKGNISGVRRQLDFNEIQML